MNFLRQNNHNYLLSLRKSEFKTIISKKRANNNLSYQNSLKCELRSLSKKNEDHQKILKMKYDLSENIKSSDKTAILFKLQELRKFIGCNDYYEQCPTLEFYKSGILAKIFQILKTPNFNSNFLILGEIFWIFCNCSIGTREQIENLTSNSFLNICDKYFGKISDSVDLNIVWSFANASDQNESFLNDLINSDIFKKVIEGLKVRSENAEFCEKCFEFFGQVLRQNSSNRIVF